MKKISFRSLSIRLFLSFLVLTTVILFLASIVIYNRYTSQVVKETNSAAEKMLSQTAYSVDFIWDWMSNYIFELYNDGYVFNSIYGKNVTYVEEQYADKKMAQAVINNPLVHSVYLYNKNMDRVYSTLGTPYSIEEFYDKDVLNLLENKSLYRQLNFIPRESRYKIYGKEYEKNVFTLVVTESPLIDEPIEGALVFNIKESQVQNLIQSMNPDKEDKLFIIDENGKVVSHSDSEMFLADLSSEKYIKKIINSPSDSGYITDIIDGEKSLVTFTSSHRMKWKFVRITPYGKVLEKTYGMRNLIVVLCFILFISVFAISLWISRRLYSPIGQLVQKIHNQVEDKGNSKNITGINEVEYITESFKKVVDNVNYLQHKSRDNNNLIRQELLRNLLKDASSCSRGIEGKFEELNIKIKPGNMMMFLLRIDDYWNGFCRQNNEEGQSLLRFAVANIANELTSIYFVNEAVDMGGEYVAVVFNVECAGTSLDDESIRLLEERVIEIIKQIQINCSNYLKLTLSGCFSYKVAKSLLELPATYELVKDFSNYRLVYGKESVMTVNMISSNIREEYSYSDETENGILDSLRLHKLDQIEEKLDKLFENLHHMSYGDIIMSISRLSYASLKVIDVIDHSDRADRYVEFGVLYKQIEKFDTLEEIKGWLLDIYRKTIEKADDSAQNLRKSYVEKIKEIIGSEYGSTNLTIEELAARVSLSANYMRSIFKEATGISLSDYINEFRYEKAKELLKDTELTVAEICTKIGIINENYFFTSFKKYCGLTPNQFRKNARERQ